MFKCPVCNEELNNFKCANINHKIPFENGIYYFTSRDNLNLKEEDKYIGYNMINLDFDPTLIYCPDRFSDNFGVFGASAEKLVKSFQKEIKVLDLGCGLGTATIPLAESGAKTIGVDISEAMLITATKRLKKEYDNLYFCKMNAYDLKIKDNSIDVVVENAMIHLVSNPEKVYKEIKRVLKKDGALVRFMTKGISISESKNQKSKKVYDTFKDILNYYKSVIDSFGYEPVDFNNNYFLLEEKHFIKTETVITNYVEEFNEFMKFRMHRLKHKAFSFLQNIPDEIHLKAFDLTNEYASNKYGSDYINFKNYAKYQATYDVYERLSK